MNATSQSKNKGGFPIEIETKISKLTIAYSLLIYVSISIGNPLYDLKREVWKRLKFTRNFRDTWSMFDVYKFPNFEIKNASLRELLVLIYTIDVIDV